MLQYRIIKSKGYDLAFDVNEAIKLGWEPLGGPCLDASSSYYTSSFLQAMTKELKEK